MDPLLGAAAIGGGMNMVSGAIGAGFQAAQNRKNQQWQEHMQKAQWQAQEYFMGKQNEMNRENAEWSYSKFDSPAAQRAAMEAAGMNPFAANGSAIQPGASSSSPSVDQGSSGSVPPANFPSPWDNIQPAFAQAANLFMDAKMKQAQIRKTNAETLGVELRNRAQENENSLFELYAADKYEQYLSNHFNRKRAEYEDTIKELRFQMEQGENMAVVLEKLSQVVNNLASAAKTDADRLWLDELNKSLVDLRKSQAGAADASAGLAKAQTETEDQLRPERLKELIANSRNTRLKNILQSVEVQRILDGTDRVTSMFGFIDKLVTETPRQTLRAFGIDNEEEYRKMLMDEFMPDAGDPVDKSKIGEKLRPIIKSLNK